MRSLKSVKENFITRMMMGAIVLSATTQFAFCQDTNKIISAYQMESVPITTVIENLARLSELNYIYDPRLYGPTPNGPYRNRDGKIISEPLLTFSWEKMTAEQALARLLEENNLYTVKMENTPIVQISHIQQEAGIVDAALLGKDTNTVIPVIKMQSVSIGAALKQLAKSAGIKVIIDPKLLKPANDEDVSSTIISLHWKGVTARQAMIALCENFGLDLVKDSAADIVRIEPKK
jgi:hypothetical protein